MQLWRFYEKCVGMWVIESNRSLFHYPLKPGEDTSGPVREYFNHLNLVLDATGDLFMLRYVENPPGSVLLKSYGQLLPGEIRGELIASSLGRTIMALEVAMDGKVVSCGSGMGAAVNGHGFS